VQVLIKKSVVLRAYIDGKHKCAQAFPTKKQSYKCTKSSVPGLHRIIKAAILLFGEKMGKRKHVNPADRIPSTASLQPSQK
jgi:hypothetical protein